jgi:hypothetical protein
VSDLLYTTKPRRYLGPVHVDLFPKCIIDQTSNLDYTCTVRVNDDCTV